MLVVCWQLVNKVETVILEASNLTKRYSFVLSEYLIITRTLLPFWSPVLGGESNLLNALFRRCSASYSLSFNLHAELWLDADKRIFNSRVFTLMLLSFLKCSFLFEFYLWGFSWGDVWVLSKFHRCSELVNRTILT